MDKLRLVNYRCLADTGDVELRPITILLGANSSGKSSFIKFFPLLRQSIGTTVNGLFLWDGQYVDFKDFKNTVKDGQGEIQVDYVIGTLLVKSLFRQRSEAIKDVRVSMTLASKDDSYDYLKRIMISYDKVNITYEFESSGKKGKIVANGMDSINVGDENIEVGYDNGLLPSLRFTLHTNSYGITGLGSPTAIRELKMFRGDKDTHNPIFLLDMETEENVYVNWSSIFSYYQKLNHAAPLHEVERITNIHIYMMSGRILNAVNDYFYKLADKFSYVLPLRSIMSRYYRFQNRAVDYIDPDGDNLAMFLNSLSKEKIGEFNSWLSEIFHFTIGLRKSEGHVELIIREDGREDRNLLDVGFGYTQILPILTIIWKSIYSGQKSGSREKTPITIAVEQPELHLHPRFQAFFAEMLALVMGDCHRRRIDVRIIIETHSEVIVNKLGQLIDQKKSGLKASDVNVVLFNAKKEGMKQYVHSTSFSDDGYLKEWPFGFFSDENVY